MHMICTCPEAQDDVDRDLEEAKLRELPCTLNATEWRLQFQSSFRSKERDRRFVGENSVELLPVQMDPSSVKLTRFTHGMGCSALTIWPIFCGQLSNYSKHC